MCFFLFLHDHEMRVSARIPVCSNLEAGEGEGLGEGQEFEREEARPGLYWFIYLVIYLSTLHSFFAGRKKSQNAQLSL